MCGLSGVIKRTHLTSNERKAFIDLGSLSFLRGTDSTGVAVLTKKKVNSKGMHHTIIKDTDHAVDFFMRKDVLAMIHNNKAVCLLGHARFATHGEINQTNAQPMRSGRIIGTHNGVLKKYEPTKQEAANYTDSRKLFDAFNESKDIPKVIDGLYSDDSYALVWVDVEKDTINFLRNKKRPLYICKSDGKALFWSSDMQMIAFALIRNGITYDEINELPEGVLLTTNLTTGVATTKVIKEKEIETFHWPLRTTAGTATATSVPSVRVVPRSELPSASMGAAASHQRMQDFMRDTTKSYMDNQSALIPEASNVVPLVVPTRGETALVPWRTEWEQALKEKDEKEKGSGNAEGTEPKAGTQGSEEIPSFLRRPSMDSGVSSAAHNLDRASYVMRKHGVQQYVSTLVAESHLRNGCKSCNCKPSVEDTVYWKSPSEYLCDECYDDENVRHAHKFEGEVVMSDLILDAHISMYGG